MGFLWKCVAESKTCTKLIWISIRHKVSFLMGSIRMQCRNVWEGIQILEVPRLKGSIPGLVARFRIRTLRVIIRWSVISLKQVFLNKCSWRFVYFMYYEVWLVLGYCFGIYVRVCMVLFLTAFQSAFDRLKFQFEYLECQFSFHSVSQWYLLFAKLTVHGSYCEVFS